MNIITGEQHGQSRKSLPIVKIRASRGATLVIQMAEPIWVGTHYLGHQLLCAGENCPACCDRALRVKGFLPVLAGNPENLRAALLEVTDQTWNRALGQASSIGLTIEPGLIAEVTREKTKSPLRINFTGEGGQLDYTLDIREDILSCVAILHRLRPLRIGESVSNWEHDTRDARASLIKEAL